jgi:hypothetical protein
MEENTTNQISALAYELWEKEGHPEGQALDHWLRAESQLRGTQTSMEDTSQNVQGSNGQQRKAKRSPNGASSMRSRFAPGSDQMGE